MSSPGHPEFRFPANITAAFILAAGLCAGFAFSAAASVKILKFGYILSPDSQLGEGEKVFAAEVAARTGGRYIIENYPNAMLGGEVAMMQDVKLGALDLAFITGAPLPKLLPEAGVFNIPFLFRDVDEARAVLDGRIGADYLRKFDKIGLLALAWGENGMRHITNSKRPIRTPEDLDGLKLRLPQSDVMEAGFKALGADVQQIPFPQVYRALRGVSVDGEENPIATILSARFYEVQTYLTLTGHVYDPAIIMMSEDAFNALSDADKQAFKEAARLAALQSRKVASELEKTGVASLKADGMSVIEVVDRAAFAKRVSAASTRFEREFGSDVIERIKRAAAASGEAAKTETGRPAQ
jgi:tripartite ATP-independent transporter DctP family solute receptor